VLRHAAGEYLPRHVHRLAFATVVLTGAYEEAGDAGRYRATPGSVLLHRPYEHHLDRVEARGAEVVVIHLGACWTGVSHGHLRDPDVLVKLAEKDPVAAGRELLEQLEPLAESVGDWPDLLAAALREDPSLRLADWANSQGVSFGSLSRGFLRLYGVTPATYRLTQRTHRAIEQLAQSPAALGTVALNCGFADQAHMSRAVRRMTSLTPRALRRTWP
jgi:AraC-like DNA-binding protein